MNVSTVLQPMLETAIQTAQKAAFSDNLCRNILLKKLKGLEFGRLTIFDNGQIHTFGQISDETTLHASISVTDYKLWSTILTRGSIGCGEAWMKHYWHSPDLTNVIRLFVRNRHVLKEIDGNTSLPARMGMRAIHWMNRNTEEGSRNNIAAHYDLSNDFFKLFLDPTMMYSSAVYDNPNQTLDEAATYKLHRICEKLELSEQDHLLEIGTGWGGMAIYAAKEFGARVTTTTISQEQYDEAVSRVKKAGLSDRITVLLKDYRQLDGQYDKLVSIEMIEAVGAEFHQEYFEICAQRLRPGGKALIQAITIREDLYETYLSETDFIRHYIFPGGCLPTLNRMISVTDQHTDLSSIDIEDITLDYAQTLAHWRERFLFHIPQIMGMGFDLEFIRMWEFYLCYCEGGFREGNTGTHQLLFSRS